MQIRKPTSEEMLLLKHLISISEIEIGQQLDGLTVSNMDDGGMGSLLLHPKNITDDKRIFGGMISEYEFKDVDGVTILASLSVDSSENLFEIDLWKMDYSPLVELPNKY